MKRTLEEEKVLIERARAGDEGAQSAIYEDYYARVHSVCWRVMNDPADGEDMTQKTFIQFFRKLDLFRGDSALFTYLYRLAVNECCMEKRRRKTAMRYGDRFGSLTSETDAAIDCPDPIKFIGDEKVDLRRALAQLPPGYYNTLVLKDVYGYEHDEIARIMRVSVGTTKTQLHKARMKMRRLLETGEKRNSYERQIAAAV